MLASGRKAVTKLDSVSGTRDVTLPTKVCVVKAVIFFSSHIWMWELDLIKGWVPKNWWFRIVVLEKTLENPLDSKEVPPVHPKGNQSWIFIGWTDAEAETPIPWPPHAKDWLIWKDPDAGKDLSHKGKSATEDKMVGWHHQLDGHEPEQTLGVGGGQGSLVCCSSWSCKEADTTEWLNSNNVKINVEMNK